MTYKAKKYAEGGEEEKKGFIARHPVATAAGAALGAGAVGALHGASAMNKAWMLGTLAKRARDASTRAMADKGLTSSFKEAKNVLMKKGPGEIWNHPLAKGGEAKGENMSKQSLAIAYGMKKRANKMAHGGEAKKEGMGKTIATGLAAAGVGGAIGHYSARAMGYAKGGSVKGGKVDAKKKFLDSQREKVSEDKGWNDDPQRQIEIRFVKKDPTHETKYYAEGGEAHTHDESCYPDCHEDGEVDGIVKRIMMGRANGYSEGGKVANDDEAMADEMPNEFDDLALDDNLEGHDTAASEGDELGGPDKDDIVARAMMKRRKQHNPRPA